MPATLVVPRAGAVATVMLDETPDMELERSIAVPWLSYPTATAEGAVMIGAAGVATVSDTIAGEDVPPGPVAVNVKLSAPYVSILGV